MGRGRRGGQGDREGEGNEGGANIAFMMKWKFLCCMLTMTAMSICSIPALRDLATISRTLRWRGKRKIQQLGRGGGAKRG